MLSSMRRLVFLCAIGLGGCVSIPESSTFSEYLSSVGEQQSDQARVFFYSADLDSDTGQAANIKIDGEHIGTLEWPHSFFSVDLPEGPHTITGYAPGFDDELQLELSGGETLYIEALYRGVHAQLLLVEEEEGLASLESRFYRH